MSTGLRGPQNGTSSFSRRCASSGIGATSSAQSLATSAISAPTPPDTVSRPRRRPSGAGAFTEQA